MEIYKKQRLIGGFICLFSIVLFFASMSYFNMFDKKFSYGLLPFIKVFIVMMLPILIGFFGIGYIYLGKKGGILLVKILSLVFAIAYLIGFLKHT
jgi:hypothetical protein